MAASESGDIPVIRAAATRRHKPGLEGVGVVSIIRMMRITGFRRLRADFARFQPRSEVTAEALLTMGAELLDRSLKTTAVFSIFEDQKTLDNRASSSPHVRRGCRVPDNLRINANAEATAAARTSRMQYEQKKPPGHRSSARAADHTTGTTKS